MTSIYRGFDMSPAGAWLSELPWRAFGRCRRAAKELDYAR